MAYTGRLPPKGEIFSGFRYMKAVADPDLHIRGGGGEGAGLLHDKEYCRAFMVTNEKDSCSAF